MGRKYHFPPDIELQTNPLLEAWLEIRWQLQALAPGGPPQVATDPYFPFAVGLFYESVKDSYQYREELDASQVPPGLFPYVVRYRFRPGEGEWPLMQLGPGVATVNFTKSYTWDRFKEASLYLRSKLLQAYRGADLIAETLILRYRNGIPFEYGSEDLLRFLEERLNTSIALPPQIPGFAGSTAWPSSASIVLTFDLSDPRGTGTVRLSTGGRRQAKTGADRDSVVKMLLWQFEVASGGADAPDIREDGKFTSWLTSAHALVHEWFFASIEGPLAREYKPEVK